MQAHQLRPPSGAKHAKKRVGRGNASGHGTYSTRGLKGQKARAGNKPRRFFEGGQTELMRRLPRKRGFINHFRKEFTAVNLRDLERFADGADVTPEALKEMGVITSLAKPVKVLGTGDISRKLNITVHRFSGAAREKIEAAGGTATALMPDVDRKAAHPNRKRASGKKKKGPAQTPAAEGKGDAKAEKTEEAPAEKENSGDSE